MNGGVVSQQPRARLPASLQALYDVDMFRRNLVAVLVLAATSAAVAAPVAPMQAYTRLLASQLVDFRYSFPTIVGSNPELLASLKADRSSAYAKALAGARDDASFRRPKGFPFHAHEFWRDWTVAGQSDRLMALRSQTETFTGGAHGMHVTGLKLWDKAKQKEITFAVLFSSPDSYWPLLKPRFCAALARERMRRVQMESPSCPEASDLVLIPADTNSDWAFDTIEIVADPYVAGSYAEGRYEIRLPVTAAFIAALAPDYRSSFKAQREQ